MILSNNRNLLAAQSEL